MGADAALRAPPSRRPGRDAPEEREATLWIGFRLFLSGRPVFVGHRGDDHYRIPLPLDAGRNTLIVHLENVGYDCKMKARIEGDAAVSVMRKPK